MVDLDELDRLHAASPRAVAATVILRAYPALAAEVRALRAKLAERDAEIEALREVAAAAEAYRACREGMQTQGGQNTIDRRDTAARLAEALAKVPR